MAPEGDPSLISGVQACYVYGSTQGALSMIATKLKWIAGVSACALLAACEAPDSGTASPPGQTQTTADKPVQTDVPAGVYSLDRAHATLLFRVDHLGFSKYTARFRQFDAQLQFDPANFSASSVTVTIDPASIETDYPDPATVDFNAELRGQQWLDAAQFPQMTFTSRSVEPTGPNTMRINGELTLRGVSRPMTLDAKFNGGYRGHPMDPHARIGFSAHGWLKRSEFGMRAGIPEPGSKMGVSDEVEVIVEAEFSGPPLSKTPGEPTSQS
jgi:polyisoprenoid-binding protein YceI